MESGGNLDQTYLMTVWHTCFKKGTDFDLWGQPVEAIDSYRRLSEQLKLAATPESLMFTDQQKKVIGKIATCLDLRSKSLQHPGRVEGVSLEDLKKLEESLLNLPHANNKEFPLDICAVQAAAQALSKELELAKTQPTSILQTSSLPAEEEKDHEEEQKTKGKLLPPPNPVPGKTMMSIRIEKIGLKDALQYIDPFIRVHVKDQSAMDITAIQETPVASYKEDMYIFFGVDVHIQKPLEFLPVGFAIFFEFIHYKPKKQLSSTKCWAFMEHDEVKDGSIIIELYKKPIDFRRRKINLLTVKPLYLHLKMSLN